MASMDVLGAVGGIPHEELVNTIQGVAQISFVVVDSVGSELAELLVEFCPGSHFDGGGDPGCVVYVSQIETERWF